MFWKPATLHYIHKSNATVRSKTMDRKLLTSG